MGITIRQVSFCYNGVKALQSIDLSFGEGITAVMGRNGAGKTTLLQLAAGILTPDEGEIWLDSESYAAAKGRLRRTLGFLPQTVDFPGYMTPRKLISYLAQLRFLEARLGLQELERLGISHLADRRFEELSMGEIRLVGIAQACMGAPRFLLLDEFTRNLGMQDRQRIFSRLSEINAGRVIIFSTHVCEDVEALAGRVILLDDGKIGFQGQPAALISAANNHVFRADLSDKQTISLQKNAQISRESHGTERGWVRFVGDAPDGVSVQAVEPTFEEACLWFFRKKKE